MNPTSNQRASSETIQAVIRDKVMKKGVGWKDEIH